MTKTVPDSCLAMPMTVANGMSNASPIDQLKQAITDVGGAVNFQVKYKGKANKSYLIPQSSLPSKVYPKF